MVFLLLLLLSLFSPHQGHMKKKRRRSGGSRVLPGHILDPFEAKVLGSKGMFWVYLV